MNQLTSLLYHSVERRQTSFSVCLAEIELFSKTHMLYITGTTSTLTNSDIDKPWVNSRSPCIGRRYQLKRCGFQWANDWGPAVKLIRGGRIVGMLEFRTSEFRAILQALDLGYHIEGRISYLELFQQCDSGRHVVKGKLMWCLVSDSHSE